MHNRDFRRPYRPAKIIKQVLCDFDHGKILLESHSDKIVQRNFLVTWEKPDEDWIKLNCDGALKFAYLRAGCGGLLQGADGYWIQGFCRFVGDILIIKAKAWALLEGVRLASTCGST